MPAPIPLISPSSVDAAWAAYERLCRAERDDPTLGLDRAHVQARMLAHAGQIEMFRGGNADCSGGVVGDGGSGAMTSPFLAFRQWLAIRKLQRIVDQTRESYEIRRYREKRAAALKHTRKAAA